MAEGYFTEAGSLMREGGLDPREVSTAHFFVIMYSFILLKGLDAGISSQGAKKLS